MCSLHLWHISAQTGHIPGDQQRRLSAAKDSDALELGPSHHCPPHLTGGDWTTTPEPWSFIPKASLLYIPLLTHLCLDGPGLLDLSDWLHKATLSFCLCHHQTCHFVSQVFQSTPEPTGQFTALSMKDRWVKLSEHLWERRVGGLGRQELYRLQMLPLGNSCCPENRREAQLSYLQAAVLYVYQAPERASWSRHWDTRAHHGALGLLKAGASAFKRLNQDKDYSNNIVPMISFSSN